MSEFEVASGTGGVLSAKKLQSPHSKSVMSDSTQLLSRLSLGATFGIYEYIF
jgi:hypothetical protein